MNWGEIIIAIVSSSALTTLIGAFFSRKKNNADANKVQSEIDGSYADRLEKRIHTLEVRQERYEMRDAVQQSAINCAHKCQIPDDECPVMIYLESHPIMSITDKD